VRTGSGIVLWIMFFDSNVFAQDAPIRSDYSILPNCSSRKKVVVVYNEQGMTYTFERERIASNDSCSRLAKPGAARVPCEICSALVFMDCFRTGAERASIGFRILLGD
jgi:hypothetical protein